MYEQAQPVRSPVVGPGYSQTSGPQTQAPSVHQSGLHGRACHGNAAYHKRQKGLETSSDTYEDAETVNLPPPIREARLQRAGLRGEPPMEGADGRNIRRHVNSPDATDTSTDNTYPSETNGRCGLRDFVRPYRGCITRITAVVATLVILVLLVVMVFNVKKDFSQLSDTLGALKRDVDGISRLSDTVDALKRNMDGISRLSDTVDALKRNMDNERNSTAAKMACLGEKVHYSGCKNPAILIGDCGTFTSPGYPNNYNDNARCSWTITVSSGRRAAIRFISLDLEQSSGCRYDSVTVYDGSTSSGKQLGKFCGTTGRHVVASGRTAHIIFTSDSSNSGIGFSIKFSGVSDFCHVPED
ncbi:PREDICTED: uncharacterized protein LOC109475954 [Branchiostoma belcheri]|uniref:Uncharacterized protein LOC109475954 n=1 Tax=Branchiostoma belcheri TaxID=7741 RepID=A0A6P4ZMP1_BRABE|nr:PREDICTED: uncharacterized protein LOC109475954 [Branchiostoma belcheri]